MSSVALSKLIEAVEAGVNSEIGKLSRDVFSTACQDWSFQIREENCNNAYRGSLDAAKALHDSLVPEWDYVIGHVNGGLSIYAKVGPYEEEYADNPARAWLLAILKAKLQEDGE